MQQSKETMSFDLDTYLPDDVCSSYPNINDIIPSFMPSGPVQDETLHSSGFEPPPQLRSYPQARRGPPSRDSFPGDLDFHVEIDSSETKKKYLYSHRMGRIYVDMKQDFAVHFHWKFDKSPNPIFVRAMIVFTDKAQAEKRVERCIQHNHEDKDREIFFHILRSSRELKDSQGVYYDGDQKQSDSWYSVVVQYDPSNSGLFSHAYRFVCKNSCSNGINRRQISIIFTLEDLSGKVYGRELVGARVCACPRRDMRRDEDELDNKRLGKRRCHPHPPEGAACKNRRIKTESPDDDLVVIPSIQVTDVRIGLTGLGVMLDMMEMARDKCGNEDKYNQCIESLKRQIDELRSTSETSLSDQ